jgi:hypothetical protein
MLPLTMTPEEAKQLQAHLEAAAAILFKNTPAEQLKNFESIELAVRDHMLEQVSPQMGNFFTQRCGNEQRQSAESAKLSRSTEG